MLLWIHRSYFAQAIIDCPTNPLRSQYAPSFLATYRASVIVLKTIKNQFQRYPRLCSRFWLIWTYAFSAAVRLFLFLPLFPSLGDLRGIDLATLLILDWCGT